MYPDPMESTLRKTTTEPHYAQFMESHGITHKTFDMLGTKKVAIPATMMLEIMAIVLNPENHPLLIHCNHGIVSPFLLPSFWS